ncbi:MAG: hypothetical protein M1821_006640 [Bathelium mastoideum]|nr:MAG: hypothetical protein M1821_006640 [Bathelium mastoideum]
MEKEHLEGEKSRRRLKVDAANYQSKKEAEKGTHNHFEQSQFYGPVTAGTSSNILYGKPKRLHDFDEEDASSKRLHKLLPAVEIKPSTNLRSEEVQEGVASKRTDSDTFSMHDEEAGCNDLEEQDGTGTEADLYRELGEISSQFQTLYASFDNDSMWKLPSGTTVEVVLNERMKNMDKNTAKLYLPLKFILDPRQQEVMDWFNAVDQEHIREAMGTCKLPDLPTNILDKLKIVETVIDGKTFRKARSDLLAHEDEIAEYLVYALSHYYHMNNNGDKFGQPDALETWNITNVVAPILDRCIQTIKHVIFHRSEKPCDAVAQRRKLIDPSSPHPRRGAKQDGLLTDKKSHLAYALQNKVNNKIDSKKKLMDIGIIEHGYTLQILGMKSFGHVAVVCPLASDVEIPTDLTIGGKLLARPLRIALEIRQHVLNIRKTIQEAYLDESPSQATLIPSSTPKVIQDGGRRKSKEIIKPSS